jgi:hypothetical protein
LASNFVPQPGLPVAFEQKPENHFGFLDGQVLLMQLRGRGLMQLHDRAQTRIESRY